MPSHLDISYVPRNIRTLPFHLPSAVFLGAQRPNLLNSEKAGKEKGKYSRWRQQGERKRGGGGRGFCGFSGQEAFAEEEA